MLQGHPSDMTNFDKKVQVMTEHMTKNDKAKTKLWQGYDKAMKKDDEAMTMIWQRYDNNMTRIWQWYDNDMTKIWQRYDKAVKKLWQWYEELLQSYDKAITKLWQAYNPPPPYLESPIKLTQGLPIQKQVCMPRNNNF